MLAAARESHESYSQLDFELEQEIIDERSVHQLTWVPCVLTLL